MTAKEAYAIADAVLARLKVQGIAIAGHNTALGGHQFGQPWVRVGIALSNGAAQSVTHYVMTQMEPRKPVPAERITDNIATKLIYWAARRQAA